MSLLAPAPGKTMVGLRYADFRPSADVRQKLKDLFRLMFGPMSLPYAKPVFVNVEPMLGQVAPYLEPFWVYFVELPMYFAKWKSRAHSALVCYL